MRELRTRGAERMGRTARAALDAHTRVKPASALRRPPHTAGGASARTRAGGQVGPLIESGAMANRDRDRVRQQVEGLMNALVVLEHDDDRAPADVELRTLMAIQIELLLDIRDLLAEERD